MASDTFTEESEEKRPAVQVGDPFTEKLLLEACLELFKTDCVVGIQDMGAAGLTSSSTEMASRGGTGIDLWMDKVPRREENLTPYELMLSESQERMLMVLKKGKEEIAENIFKKWALDFSVIGEVTDKKILRLFDNDDMVAEIPIDFITDSAPVYNRPAKQYSPPQKPELNGNIKKRSIEDVFLQIITSPTITNKKWIFEQYDYMVRTNTMFLPLNDSALLKIKNSDKALAITSNCNSRYCYLNPRNGTKIAVAESARNIACSGARPLAITDCLNFGNPENPEIMWQFQESIEGMDEACRVFNTPVVSGNVSFYNQTGEEAIYPTPTVGMVGVINDYRKIVSQWFMNEGDIIVLLGDTREEMGGSEFQLITEGIIYGDCPEIDLDKEMNLISTLIECIDRSIIISAHDISEGGIAVALAECCLSAEGRIGYVSNLEGINLEPEILLFTESQSRCIVSINKQDIQLLKDIAEKNSVNAKLIGVVGGNKMIIENVLSLDVDKIFDLWNKAFEDCVK